MRSDLIRLYKDVHIWVGIVSGLGLFVAFYAGAITMFEGALSQWAAAPVALPAAPPLEHTERLVAAIATEHPDATKRHTVHLVTGPTRPRLTWQEGGIGRRRIGAVDYGASLDAAGRPIVARLAPPPVAEFVNVLHQQVGLPLPHEVALLVMGVIALLYALALISGVVILLPSLVKDLFALRIGANVKRMWLDAHNLVGLFGLPFHIVMALTSVIFAFHDQIYALQDRIVWHGTSAQAWKRPPLPLPPAGARPLPAAALAQAATRVSPGFVPDSLNYARDKDGRVSVTVGGTDGRYLSQRPSGHQIVLDGFSGRPIEPRDLPGRQTPLETTVQSFFALHFGSYGGPPVRWGYFALGMGGAFLFYSGNLLWIESRRRKARRGAMPEQTRACRVLGCLTLGVALGTVTGISLTIAAARWLPGRVGDVALAHELIFYASLTASTGWAFARGPARAGAELLIAAAVTTALVPLSTVLDARPGASAVPAIDATATVGALLLLMIARRTRKRALAAPWDSLWSVAEAPTGKVTASTGHDAIVR